MSLPSKLKAVRTLVGGHRNSLYEALAAIYMFRVDATVGDSDHTGWKAFAKAEYEKSGWKYTGATESNLFTAAIRLAFNTNPEKPEYNAQPISKFAKALQYAYDKKGFKKQSEVAAFFKKRGVTHICDRVEGGGGTVDDSKKIDAGKHELKKLLASAPSVAVHNVSGTAPDRGYALVLAHFDKTDKMKVVKCVATELDGITKKFIKAEAPGSDVLSHPFGNLIMVLKSSFNIANRMVVLDNEKDGAKAYILNPENQKLLAFVNLPFVKGLPKGRWVFPTGTGYLQQFKDAHKYEWTIEKRTSPVTVGPMVEVKKAGMKIKRPLWSGPVISNYTLVLVADKVKRQIDLLEETDPLNFTKVQDGWRDKIDNQISLGSSHGQQLMAVDALVAEVVKSAKASASKIKNDAKRKEYRENNVPKSYVIGVGSHGIQALTTQLMVSDETEKRVTTSGKLSISDTKTTTTELAPITSGQYTFDTPLPIKEPFSTEMYPGLLSKAVQSFNEQDKKTAILNLAASGAILVSGQWHGMEVVIAVDSINKGVGWLFVEAIRSAKDEKKDSWLHDLMVA